jgi:hypothetical protein
MSRRRPDRTGPKPDLLRLWMGAPDEPPPVRPSIVRSFLQVLLAAGGVVAVALLAKYAVDVLAILLAIFVAGLVVYIVGTRLAESTLLTPGTFAIAAAVVALFAYAFLAPADGMLSLSRYLPSPVVRFLAWSEERGWAGRAFSVSGSPAGGSLPDPGAASPAPASPPPVAASSRPGAAAAPGTIPPPTADPVSLSLSSPASSAGQAVVLIARLGEGTERDEVWFYDGATLLGTATVRLEGGARIASLTVTTLQPGDHTLRAAIAGPWGLWSRRSAPVQHTVR